MGFLDLFGIGNKEAEKREVDAATSGKNGGDKNESTQSSCAMGELTVSSGKDPFITEVYEHLKYCGLVPNMDEDGFIFFNYQMINIIFGFHDKLPGYVRMMALGVAAINENNKVKAYEVANKISENYICIKAVCEENSMSLHLEHIFKDMEQFKYLLGHFLNIIIETTRIIHQSEIEWLTEKSENISNN